jgi:nitroreductase
MIADLVRRTRSVRRFRQERAVGLDTLKELVDLARITASGGNRQPLKYVLSCAAAKNEEVFACLSWAAYLKDWPGPAAGERPAAYIVVLGDSALGAHFDRDLGIAAQTIVLAAADKGLGGCMLDSIDRGALGRALELSPGHKILLVVALGWPAEAVVIETVGPDGDTRYWRDARGVHHVPKRRLEDVVVAAFP